MKSTIMSMFEPSEQAVLLFHKASVYYANPRAQKLLGFDPTEKSAVELFQQDSARVFSTKHDPVVHYKNVWVANQIFHVSRTEFGSDTLFFLYSLSDPQFTESYLHNSALSLLALVRELPECSQKTPMEALIRTILSLSNLHCAQRNFYEFFDDTISLFDRQIATKQLEIDSDSAIATVYLYPELMHSTFIFLLVAFLKLVGRDGTLKLSCRQQNDCVDLVFELKNTPCSDEIRDAFSAATETQSFLGSVVFRAKQVFALHGSALSLTEHDSGFACSASLPCTKTAPALYTPLSKDDMPLDRELVRSLILAYLEEA